MAKEIKVISELSDKIAFAKWMKQTYPFAIFEFKFFDDVQMDERTRGQYFQLQSGKKKSDFHLSYPIHGKHGLYLEFKLTEADLYKKDGTFINDHVKGQNDMLVTLRALGYSAFFVVGLEQAKQAVESYFQGG